MRVVAVVGACVEVEVRFNVRYRSEAEESSEFGHHDVYDCVYVGYAVSLGGLHVGWGCMVSGGAVVAVVLGVMWGWGEYVVREKLG